MTARPIPPMAQGMREMTSEEFYAHPIMHTDVIGWILPGRSPFTTSIETRGGQRKGLIVEGYERNLLYKRYFLVE